MIKSMTGFGRCEITEESRRYTVEMKSVNHRYFDLNIKMPKSLNLFESAIRSLLKEYIERGKVDLYITFEDLSEDRYSLKYNEELAGLYLAHLRKMSEKFGLEDDIRVSTLSRYPDVFTMEQNDPDEKELWTGLKKAVCGAAEQLVESRIAEGSNLMQDLAEKLDTMLTYVNFIEERSPAIMKSYRERLEAKVKEILVDRQMDEARIVTEVTIYADKICVDEETVRLRSHIKNMKKALKTESSIGRRMDFLAQEMNREANTILSKTDSIELSDVGINLKTDIEKVREQIQNIE